MAGHQACANRGLTVYTKAQPSSPSLNPAHEYQVKAYGPKAASCYYSLKRRADSLEKTLVMGKTEGKRRRGWQRLRWLDSITDSTDTNLSKLRETVADRGAWCVSLWGRRVRHDSVTELQMLQASTRDGISEVLG